MTLHYEYGDIPRHMLQHPPEIQQEGHAQTTSRHSPTAFSSLSVFRLRKSLASTGALIARGTDGGSVLAAPCRPRLSSTCFTISTIRLKSRPAAAAGVAVEGALSPQCPVSAHISSTSPMLKCFRSPLIAPVEWEERRKKKKEEEEEKRQQGNSFSSSARV